MNLISDNILACRVPRFMIQYPEHVARFGSLTLSPQIEDGVLQEDFGFLFQGRSRLGTRCVVVCGVWATGTELACVSYAGSAENESVKKVRRLLRKNSQMFVVLRSPVQNYQIGEPRLIAISERPDRQSPHELKSSHDS
ncbi:MAG: hypothetical protein KF871_04740 [Hydrogenophaga sp.]|nr:hypothetical protein [Hydrogenophaga sp.]